MMRPVAIIDACKTHDEWLMVVRFGLSQLLKNQPVLFEVISREASRLAVGNPSGLIAADAIVRIFTELELQIEGKTKRTGLAKS
jgi:hypothetical protein